MEEIKSTETNKMDIKDQADLVLKSMEMSEQLEKINTVSDNLEEQKKIMYGYIDGADTSFIDDRLKEYTIEELTEKVKDDEFMKMMVTSPGGVLLGISASANGDTPFNDEDEMEFKRELLIHAKKTDMTYTEIDKYIADMEDARIEFDTETKKIMDSMENSIVEVVSMMKEGLEKTTDPKERKQKELIIKHIESGWTFEIINDILDKHPNIPNNLIRDMNNDTRIKQIADRYKKKLRDHGSNISLTHFVSSEHVNRKSIEKTLLKPDQYKYEDLFIFMIIRFFSMANWNDRNIARAHISIAVSLKRVMKNEYPEDMQKTVIENIAKLVSRLEEAAEK